MSEQGERADSQASAVGAEREAVAREIGARLAEAREAQRLSVEDVSARLKVAAGKLTALEAGHLEALPDVIFAKGVMRAYARMLHVDIDPLLARFQPRPEPTVELVARSDGGLNQSFDERRRFGARGAGGRWVWLALVVVVIGAGVYFGFDHARQWFEARKDAMSAPHADEPAPPQSDAATGTVTAALPPVMSGADSPAPSEDTSAASAPAAAAPAPVASAPTAPAAAAPAPAPAPAAATAAPAATAATAATATTVAAPAATPAPAGAGELQIRFAADTWYEIRDRRGKVVLGGTAKAGQEVSGGGEAPYKVVIGNVKGIGSMTRNGTPVDLQAANRNNVARLTLP